MRSIHLDRRLFRRAGVSRRCGPQCRMKAAIKQIFHSPVNMEQMFYMLLRLAPVATAIAMATQKVAASERKPE